MKPQGSRYSLAQGLAGVMTPPGGRTGCRALETQFPRRTKRRPKRARGCARAICNSNHMGVCDEDA